jgi:hypothetical protein
MSSPDQRAKKDVTRKSKLLGAIAWVTIGLLVILTAVSMVWAGRQPEVHSMWAPE